MTPFKKTAIIVSLALGLLGAGCGDSKSVKKTDAGGSGGTVDAGGQDGDDSQACIGGYKGFTEQQLTDNIKDPAAACANDVDIANICSKDPPQQTREIGLACYFGAAGKPGVTPEQVATMTGECALNGKGDTAGLKTVLAPMSTECISCYVGAVVCAVQKCSTECSSGTDEECGKCREDNGCTPDFFVCSGLASSEEITAGK